MSKKILSLALVVVMLMSMFAFSTSAADLTSGQIGLRVESNAYVGMPAGEEVEFKVYYVVPDDLDLDTYRQAIGNISVAFTDAFELNDPDKTAVKANGARQWGASYVDYLKASSNVSITATYQKNIKNYATSDDSTRTWAAACQVGMGYNTDNGYSDAVGFPIDPDCEIFTLSFLTTREVTADDAIIVPKSACANATYLKLAKSEGGKAVVYTADNIVMTDNIAVPAAPATLNPTVKHIDTMGQMKNWAKGQFPFNAGLVGQISDLPLTFDGDNQCAELKKIEVSITTEAGTTTSQAYQVYKVNDTTWNFRAVIYGLTAEQVQNDEVMSCQYTIYVDHDGDASTEPKAFTSDVFETSIKAIYDEACDEYNK